MLAAQVARGRSLSDLLGAYAIVGERSYDAETVVRFFLYHLAELDLYLGVLPFAAFVLLAVLARRSDPVLAPFLAAAIALTCLAPARRRRVRVGVREPDPGAEHLLRRAVLPDRAARLGRPRAAASALGGRPRLLLPPRCCRS